MSMKTIVANPAKAIGQPAQGTGAWTADDQAALERTERELKVLREKATAEATLTPVSLEAALELTRAAYNNERASILAFFPAMVDGSRMVAAQVETDLNFTLKARKPHRFALFRVTEEGYRIGAAFIINVFGKLDTKEFRQKIEAEKPKVV